MIFLELKNKKIEKMKKMWKNNATILRGMINQRRIHHKGIASLIRINWVSIKNQEETMLSILAKA